MLEHISTVELERYRSGTISPSELIDLDAHLAQCDSCALAVAESVPARFDGLADDHLEYEQLERFVDSESDADERHMVELHVESCPECRLELKEITEMRDAIRADKSADSNQQVGVLWTAKALLERFRPLRFAVGAALFISLTALAVWMTRERGPGVVQIAETTSPAPTANIEPATSATPDAEAVEPVEAPKTASDENGDIPEQYRDELRAAESGRLEVPAATNELRESSGTLMSGSTESVPFRLVGPVGIFVETDRPAFRWRPYEGADGYVVEIYDSKFKRVTASPRLETTEWTPEAGLPRGQTLAWQVTAIVHDKKVKSPVRPAPDARFRIIDAARAAEIARLRRTIPEEHLLLGLLYAKAGLFDRARKEFQAELAKNPRSAARRLLHSLPR